MGMGFGIAWQYPVGLMPMMAWMRPESNKHIRAVIEV